MLSDTVKRVERDAASIANDVFSIWECPCAILAYRGYGYTTGVCKAMLRLILGVVKHFTISHLQNNRTPSEYVFFYERRSEQSKGILVPRSGSTRQ